ncbi:Diacylglycerol kinase epsilon, partial [Trichinella zimbabwensis]
LVYVAMTIFLILYETAKNCGLVFGVAVLTFYLIKILCTLLAESGSVHATTAQLKGHHWTLVDAFDAGYYCNVCNDSIYHGLECDYCGIVTDVSCMKKAEQSISCKSVAGVNKLEHLWVPGNLPVSSVCCVCYHNCGVGFGSNNLRCSWCQRTAHDACRHRISPNCDLSTFRQFVISPESILLETPNWRKRNTLVKEARMCFLLNIQSALNICGMCVPAELRILAASIHAPPAPMPYKPTQLPEGCKRYHGPSTDLHVKYLSHYSSFMYYVFTQILRYSHAVLDCASMKAEVWTCPDMSGLVEQSRIAGPVLPISSGYLASHLAITCYHYCYGVEPHKRKQPCTEPSANNHIRQCLESTIHNFSDNLHSWSPVVVFANRFSGSGEGYLVLKAFRRVLNPIQVCDLSQQSPKLGLELLNKIKDISKMVVLVAGGDGTVGWVFSAIEEISWPENRRPTVAVLPLGTGNDLSRVLGWGDGHSGIVDAAEILQQLSQATPVKLDRWLVSVVSPTKLGMKWSKSEYKMNNYLSVGVDALVTLNFHNRRHSLPRVLSGRFMNKFLFFTYGTKDVLERMCRNLHLHIELQLDDKPVELPELEGVVVLNIPCWGAGVKPWQMGKGGPPQLINDGLLEVGLSEPYRIGQAKKVQIRIKDCSLPMQVDGEPWRQGPSTILITHFGHASIFASEQAMMLPNATSESSEVTFKLF